VAERGHFGRKRSRTISLSVRKERPTGSVRWSFGPAHDQPPDRSVAAMKPSSGYGAELLCILRRSNSADCRRRPLLQAAQADGGTQPDRAIPPEALEGRPSKRWDFRARADSLIGLLRRVPDFGERGALAVEPLAEESTVGDKGEPLTAIADT
jgi:hypothetical protein